MPLRYPKEPPRALSELAERNLDLVRQLDAIFTVIYDQEIGTGITAVAHGLSFTPKMVIPVPHCLAMVCEAQKPDSKNVYLRASNLCVCNVWVIP